MEIAFAPLEGITGYIYRNAHHKYFGGIDKYYSPFIDARQTTCVKKKEIRDILPENNKDIILIPQILAGNADNFLRTAKIITDMGYLEINLNLGCPSKTVVTKGKGAGFLAKPDELDVFLYQIFEKTEADISVKTRIGMDDPYEFEKLLKIYNKYPIKELIIHPRLQADYYKNEVKYDSFQLAVERSNQVLCYNGDIVDCNSFQNVKNRFPSIEAIMIGRGLLQSPDLAQTLKGEKRAEKKDLYQFYETLLEEYSQYLSGEKNVMFKMKEVMIYITKAFTNHEKYEKNIKKSQHIKELKTYTDALFREQELIDKSDLLLD